MYAHQEAAKAGHMNSTEVASIAKDANVKELLLTHLPHTGNPADLVTETKQIFSTILRWRIVATYGTHEVIRCYLLIIKGLQILE